MKDLTILQEKRIRHRPVSNSTLTTTIIVVLRAIHDLQVNGAKLDDIIDWVTLQQSKGIQIPTLINTSRLSDKRRFLHPVPSPLQDEFRAYFNDLVDGPPQLLRYKLSIFEDGQIEFFERYINIEKRIKHQMLYSVPAIY